MNSRIAPAKEPQSLFLLSFFAFIELFSAGVVTLLINPDPKNALIFGFSALRLLLVAGTWILSFIILGAGITALRNRSMLDSAWLVSRGKYIRWPIYILTFILIIWGWLALFCPAYLFGKRLYTFERIQPLSIALGIALAQSWLFYLFARGRLGFRIPGRMALQKYYRPSLIFAVTLIGLGIFMASTKFGLLSDLIYSNVPGIPLSGLQFFFILLLVGLWIVLVPAQAGSRPFWMIVKKYRLMPIIIFLAAVLVWGLTPMGKHFFSQEPAAPSYQPFPLSDARLYDLGGISILHGYGIYFHTNYDKPLYMFFLAVLHFFAGFNYSLMTWLQILVLAFIPVILFYLGVKFHSAALGIFLSVIQILRQRNAILLSLKVSSVNPKLFMTEEMTLLGIVLLAYLVFLWMRDRKTWQALLCGGCIGATSLVRFNALLFFPAIACLIIPVFWGMGRKFLFRQLTIYTLAFMILLVPWIVSSVDQQGTPWLLLKLDNMIQQRYSSTQALSQGFIIGTTPSDTGLTPAQQQGIANPAPQPGGGQNQPTQENTRSIKGGIGYRLLYHFLHNFSTSVLSLPDSVIYDDLNHLSQRAYWSDAGGWQGDLPVSQIGLILLNLVLLAIGLGYSWVNYRWAGMIPLTIFLAYSISLSIAMNSGGRYLVPLDWVLYFYYGLAIIAIIRFVDKVLTREGPIQPGSPVTTALSRVPERRKVGFSLAGIICVAILIPIANFALPVLIHSGGNPAKVEAARENISSHEAQGANIVYGEILYPYYQNDRFTFVLLIPTDAVSQAIPKTPPLKRELVGGEQVFIVLSGGDAAKAQVESIYLWQAANPVLIWKQRP